MKIPHERIQEQFKATGNRLALKETAPNQPTKENFRIYGKIAGIILSFLGLARRFDALDEYGKDTTWIINKKSYKEWLTTNALAANLNPQLPTSNLIQGIREHQTTLKTSRPRPDTQAKTKEAEPLKPSTKVPLLRQYPPIGMMDTQIEGKSSKPEGKLFKDEEIREVHQRVITEFIYEEDGFPSISISRSIHHKTILQQQGLGGSTAACAAMLILDNRKKCNITEVQTRTFGNDADIIYDLKKAGLTPKIFNNVQVSSLQELIDENGSAIVSIEGEIIKHVIILDAIDELTARVRDPYHGWEITISREAFDKRFTIGSIIQVPSSKQPEAVDEIDPKVFDKPRIQEAIKFVEDHYQEQITPIVTLERNKSEILELAKAANYTEEEFNIAWIYLGGV